MGSTSTGEAVLLLDVTGPNGNTIRMLGTYYVEPESADGLEPMSYRTVIIPSSTPSPSPFAPERKVYALTIESNHPDRCEAKIGKYGTIYFNTRPRYFALRPVKVATGEDAIPKRIPKPNHEAMNEDPDIPKSVPDITPVRTPMPDSATWMKIAKLFIDRKTTYHELRRGIHYTNEPDNDWRAHYRYTGLNLSKAEYDEWAKRGIVFKEVDPKLAFKANTFLESANKMEEATKGSSYPKKGTRCGRIVHIDDKYKRDMHTGKGLLGCNVYFFAGEHYNIKKLIAIEKGTVHGMDLTLVTIEVEKQPTPYFLAYNEVIYGANKYLGGQTKPTVPQHEIMKIVLGFSYDNSKGVDIEIGSEGESDNRKT